MAQCGECSMQIPGEAWTCPYCRSDVSIGSNSAGGSTGPQTRREQFHPHIALIFSLPIGSVAGLVCGSWIVFWLVVLSGPLMLAYVDREFLTKNPKSTYIAAGDSRNDRLADIALFWLPAALAVLSIFFTYS